MSRAQAWTRFYIHLPESYIIDFYDTQVVAHSIEQHINQD